MTNSTAIALLIDADNISPKKIDFIMSELAKHGSIIVRKIYGNWQSSRLQSWQEVLLKHALKPVQQFDYIKGKNATDMAMTIDAMDLLYTDKKINTFCIVSSDSDFTPLVVRLKSANKKIIGFGEKKSPKSLVEACSQFIYLEQVQEESKKAITEITKQQPPRKKTLTVNNNLINRLKNAVKSCADHDGWASLGPIGSYINKQSPLDSTKYGFDKLSELIKSIKAFETKNTNSQLYMRDKTALKPTPRKQIKEPTQPHKTKKLTGQQLKCDTKLLNCLRKYIDTCADNNGWARVGTIGNHLHNDNNFNKTKYGYKKLSDLIQAIGLFETKIVNTQMYVRNNNSIKPPTQIKKVIDPHLITCLTKAIHHYRQANNGWTSISMVAYYLINYTDFRGTSINTGLADVIQSVDLFQTKKIKNKMYVKIK